MISSDGIDVTVPRSPEGIRSLGPRLASALVLAPVALVAIWFGGIAFELLVVGAAALMLAEWTRLTEPVIGAARVLAPLLIAGVAGALGLTAVGWPGWALAVAGLTAVAGAAFGGFAGSSWRWPPLGVLYLGLPTAAIIWLRDQPDIGRAAVLWLCAVVWTTDIAAFFVGRALGGPKLAPRLSPKKTWAGLFGGIGAAAAAGGLFGALLEAPEPALLLVAGAAAAVVAQAGDLLESALKRHFHVKDSGALIPGHGGVLDRLDGMLTTSVAGAVVVAVARVLG